MTSRMRALSVLAAILLSAACVLASVEHRGAPAPAPTRVGALPF